VEDKIFRRAVSISIRIESVP